MGVDACFIINNIYFGKRSTALQTATSASHTENIHALLAHFAFRFRQLRGVVRWCNADRESHKLCVKMGVSGLEYYIKYIKKEGADPHR